MSTPLKPSPEQLQAAQGKTIPDVLARDLDVLFVGINPSLYSAAIGHHFGRPGNRFWPALYRSGFTPYLLSPFEDQKLLDWKLGLTNLVARATARADELDSQELILGAAQLLQKVRRHRPRVMALLGVTAYRTAWQKPEATLGEQPEPIDQTRVWVLPNPSGLNAHYQLDELAKLFQEVRAALH